MATTSKAAASTSTWTLKKPVTTLAISPVTGSLTLTGRLALNVMLQIAQRNGPDSESGFSAPVSEIVKGMHSTTRNSRRLMGYIEQMCATVVRWSPLSATDQWQGSQPEESGNQPSFEGMELPADVSPDDIRVFTLLAEARFYRRGGEHWVTWYYPPTMLEMLLSPDRYAPLQLKWMVKLSHYAGLALYEICRRYREIGLTNRASPNWWIANLSRSADTITREWRKFKNEKLNPAIAEINHHTDIEVEIVEYRRGRSLDEVQFRVKAKPVEREIERADFGIVEQAESVGIREKDLDALVNEFGREAVQQGLNVVLARKQTIRMSTALPYLRTTLRNAGGPNLFAPPPAEAPAPAGVPPHSQAAQMTSQEWHERRMREIAAEMDNLSEEEIERYAQLAKARLAGNHSIAQALRRRFESRQYRSPLVWTRIREEYALEHYGPGWAEPPTPAADVVEMPSA